MEEKYETYAYFWVQGFDCEPTEISSLLGLEATEFHVKGDFISDKSDRRRNHSSWKYESSLPRSKPFQDKRIENLISVLSSKKRDLNF